MSERQALHRYQLQLASNDPRCLSNQFAQDLAVAKKLDAISEWGSVVAFYIAAQRIFPDYGDMADAKSLLESITRSFGYHYGVEKKVRINTVSQSPTVTTAAAA